jgi:HAD superfamily hydrolase (TIGR01549 family)
MIQAVIFDIDGTLVDSVDLHAQAWQVAFRQFGRDVPFADIRSQIGKGADQLLPVFFSAEELQRFGKELEDVRGKIFKERYLPRVKAFPKVRELFERLRSDGKKIALASSAKEDELNVYKQIARIEDLVQAETSRDDVSRSKPHPDIFEAALQALKPAAPAHVIAVGDTPYDAQAATRAGIRVIGVRCGGFPKEQLLAAGCRTLFRDPEDLLSRYDAWMKD